MKLVTSFCFALNICFLSIIPNPISSSQAYAQQESPSSLLENLCQVTQAVGNNSISDKLDRLRTQPRFEDVLLHCIYHCPARSKRLCLLDKDSPIFYNSVQGRTVPPKLIDFLIESVADCRAAEVDVTTDVFNSTAVQALVRIATTTDEPTSAILPFERSELYPKVVNTVVNRLGAEVEQRDKRQPLLCYYRLLDVINRLIPLPEKTLFTLSQSENFIHKVAAAESLTKKHWHIGANKWRGDPLSPLEIKTAMQLRSGSGKEREHIIFADQYLAEHEAKTLSTDEMFEKMNAPSARPLRISEYYFEYLPARDDFAELLARCLADVNRPAFQFCLKKLDLQSSLSWREDQADVLIPALLRVLQKYFGAFDRKIGRALYSLASAKPNSRTKLETPISSRSSLARQIEHALFHPKETPTLSGEEGLKKRFSLDSWARQALVLRFLSPFDPQEIHKASLSNDVYIRAVALGAVYYSINPGESDKERLQSLRQSSAKIKKLFASESDPELRAIRDKFLTLNKMAEEKFVTDR